MALLLWDDGEQDQRSTTSGSKESSVYTSAESRSNHKAPNLFFFFQTVLETVSRNVIITNLLIGPLHRSLEEVFDGRMVLLEKIFYKFVWIYRLDHDRQIGTVQRGLGVDLGDIINDDSCVNVC